MISVTAPKSPISLNRNLVLMLNTFSPNNRGTILEQEARRIYRMFDDQFGQQMMTCEQADYISRAKTSWQKLVTDTYNDMLESLCLGEEFDMRHAMVRLSKYLKNAKDAFKMLQEDVQTC